MGRDGKSNCGPFLCLIHLQYQLHFTTQFPLYSPQQLKVAYDRQRHHLPSACVDNPFDCQHREHYADPAEIRENGAQPP